MFDDKTIIYVDMDHVLCDYDAGFAQWQAKYPELKYPQSQPGMYLSLEPMRGAIETYLWLHNHPKIAVFILTAPSVKNPHCYAEKRLWVEQHLGMGAVNKLIISPHKGLNRGDYLIDDNITGKGQDTFEGKLIHFGSEHFQDWAAVRFYFEQILTKD
jgi:5'-nucleotidase